MHITAMTYNIHSGRDAFGELCLEGITGVIASQQPDIAAINEVRRFTEDIGGADQAAELAQGLGMHIAFAQTIPYRGGQYGIALLSKTPILSQRVVRIPDVPTEERERYFEPRCVLCCTVQPGDTPMNVLVTHIGLSPKEKQLAIQTICALLQETPAPTLLMGDFNMAPDDPMLSPLLSFVRDTSGMAPTPYTIAANAPRAKIDYIFATPDVLPGRVWTLDTTASDHLPLMAKLEIRGFGL